MNEAVKQQIWEEILAYDRIVISRHIRPDGDAIGASHGLAAILRASFPEKQVLSVGDDGSDYLAFLGPDDPQPADEFYRDALLILLDSGSFDRVSNRKKDLARRVIRIDHHVVDQPYGDLVWVEDHRSSVCEMITQFYIEHADRLVLPDEATLALYTGIVTDSGRFRFPSVSPDTLRLAAVLLETGIDTETLYARLYLDDYAHFKYQAYVYDHMRITPNGVTYLFLDQATQKKFSLDREAASNTIDYLDSIKGSLIWLAFIENNDGSIRVRLRSRFAEVRELAQRYRGGGHDRASGSTVYSWDEARKLVADADALLGAFKAENEGWL